jgi:glycosyltransferase involved in cell wall biosynthesis
MKIYINARFLTQNITGVQRYAHEMLKALDDLIGAGEIDGSSYRLVMLSPRRGLLHEPALRHIPLRKVGRLSGHAWEQLELPAYSRDGALFCPGNTAPILSLSARQVTVVTVHALSYIYFPEAYSPFFRLLYRVIIPSVLRRADAVITVSEAERKSILLHYGHADGRLHAIQSGAFSRALLNGSETPVASVPEPGKPFLLYVGSLSKGKNLEGALKAMAIVNEKVGMDMVVAGASANVFKGLRLDLPEGISGKVRFEGQVDDTGELISLYRAAACLVFPSFYESSGLPPLEAMACGCNVVASAIPALLERCGDAALYCNPHDPEDIAKKVLRILQDPALRDSLKAKGIERSRLYTWENSARETFAVIKKAARRARPGTKEHLEPYPKGLP